tara:strand:- start:12911 stop:14464 length:1554 start_codon:yes stop_codon:yes gene_type:complete
MKLTQFRPLAARGTAIVVACLGLGHGIGSAQSLQQAAKLTLHNEPEIQAANYDRLSAYENWKIVRGDLAPQVSIDGSGGYLQRDRTTDGLVSSDGDGLLSRQIGLSIRQLIYDGGLARNQTISARHGHELQALVERSMIEARIVDLAEVYLEILRAKEQVQEAKAHVSRHNDMREMIEATVGQAGNRADLALVEGRLSLAENALESQQLALDNAIVRFTRLTGQPATGLSYPPVPEIPQTEEEFSLEENWDYQAAVAALAAATHKHKSAKGNRTPKIYLDAGAGVGEDVLGVEGEDNEVRAMLVMSWDLFRGGANKALVAREHLQVRKAEELVRAAIEQSEYTRSLLWNEREGSKTSYISLSKYLSRLESALSDYKEQFKVGRQDLLNILDVQDELHTAKTKVIDAKYNVDTSAFRLAGVQGSLTEALIGTKGVNDYFGHRTTGNELTSELLSVKGTPPTGSSNSSATVVAEVSQADTTEGEPKTAPSPEPKRFRLNPFKSKGARSASEEPSDSTEG